MQLPVWQMFTNSFSLFNEEVGEISFSVLSRLLGGGESIGEREHVSMLYTLVHEYVAIDEDITIEANSYRTNNMKSGYTRFDTASSTHIAVTAFMNDMMRKLKFDQYVIYSGAPKIYNPAYTNASMGREHSVPRTNKKSFWIVNIKPIMQRELNGLESLTKKADLVARYQWPVLGDRIPDKQSSKRQNKDIDTSDDEEYHIIDNDFPEGKVNEPERQMSVTNINNSVVTVQVEKNVTGVDVFNTLEYNFDMLDELPARVLTYKVGSEVYTIDPPEPNVADDWVVTKGLVQAPIKRSKRSAGTPSWAHRVQVETKDGPTCYDISKTNLHKTAAEANTRLNEIVAEIKKRKREALDDGQQVITDSQSLSC